MKPRLVAEIAATVVFAAVLAATAVLSRTHPDRPPSDSSILAQAALRSIRETAELTDVSLVRPPRVLSVRIGKDGRSATVRTTVYYVDRFTGPAELHSDLLLEYGWHVLHTCDRDRGDPIACRADQTAATAHALRSPGASNTQR